LLQKQQQLLPTVIRFSLAAACIDAANVVARELRLGRDRVVAEYTYLDPRAVGRWDMLARSAVQPAIWALDNDQAGPDGTRGRPPPNEDGTPHETLADAAVRLRQLVSVLETQYSGDTILLIFPDGTGPALLSAMMAGIPLNRVHELEFDSGELRTNVTVGSILELWKARQDGESAESYREALDRGRATLQQLQSTSPDAIVSKKDQQIEAERLELEREFQEKKRAQQLRTEQENVARAERRSRLEAQRKSSSSPTTKVDPALLGIAGSALAGGGVAIAVYSSSSSAPPGAVELVTQAENERSTSSPGENQEGVPPAAHPGSTLLVQVQRVNGDRNGSLRFASEGGSSGRSSSSLSGAPLYPPSGSPTPASLPPLSPLEAAQKAMDEYMNRDDGAADWLQSLVDILDESEMDDDDGDNKSHDGAMPG
jgi:broad specificity phosphatase PhoE